MKCNGSVWAGLVVGLGLGVSSQAALRDSGYPYQGIVDRNVFGLKPPVVETVKPEEEPKTPPSQVKLTGITTILGRKLALLMVQDPPAAGGQAGVSQSYILTEGQREGQIEVLRIDEKIGSVTIKNGTLSQLLTFQKDGGKLPKSPAPSSGAATAPMNMTPAAAAALLDAANPASPTPNPATRQIPARTLRLPGAPPPATTQPSQTPEGLALPIPYPQQSQAPPQPPAMSLEEQIILMEAEDLVNQGNPRYPPTPPTPLNPTRNLAPPGPPGPPMP